MKPKNSLFILIAIFVIPIVLSSLFFFFYPKIFITQTVNYGTLVEPIIQLKKTDYPQGKWTLLYRTSSCDNNCKTTLSKAKTLHLLTNDNIHRLQRVLLTQNQHNTSKGDLIIKPLTEQAQLKLANFAPQTLFLIDPLGNVVFAYDGVGFNIKKALKDLERLLKYSRIG